MINEKPNIINLNYINFKYINLFNQNFICNDIQTILSLYQTLKGKWQHPLILNYNYCLICKERVINHHYSNSNSNSHILVNNLEEFFHSKKIRFRRLRGRKQILSLRRFVHSSDSFCSQNKIKIQRKNSDTNFYFGDYESSQISNNYKDNLNLKKKSHTIKSTLSQIEFNSKQLEALLSTRNKSKQIFRTNSKKFADEISFSNSENNKKLIRTKKRIKEKVGIGGNLSKINLQKETDISLSVVNAFKGNQEREQLNKVETNLISIDTCEICLERITNKFVLNCGDFYCRDCIEKIILMGINDISKFNKICCPKKACQTKLNDSEIGKILSSKDNERYLKLKKKISILKDPSLIPCPYPDCEGYAEINQKSERENFPVECENRHIYCPNCLYLFNDEEIKEPNYIKKHLCSLNKRGSDSETVNYNNSIKMLETNQFIKKCPNCKTWVQREKGDVIT